MVARGAVDTIAEEAIRYIGCQGSSGHHCRGSNQVHWLPGE